MVLRELQRDEVVFLEGSGCAGVAVGPHLRPLERACVRRGWADCLVCATGHSCAMGKPPSVAAWVQAGSGSHACASVMLTCRAWQLPAGTAATAATMLASPGAKGEAVLAGACVTWSW